MSRLIGLAGRLGSGKDTVGRMIQEVLPKTHLMSFAAPIKRICKEVFAFSDLQVNGTQEQKAEPDPRYQRADGSYLTSREAMQRLGTEWGRACYPQVWVELGLRLAKDELDAGRNVVFTDVRFTNEAMAIRKAGGAVFKIQRPIVDVPATHPSETEMGTSAFLAHVSGYIINDGGLGHLLRTVEELLRRE